MSTQVKLRRGSSSELATFTPAVGEVVVDTDNYSMVVGNGVTLGGVKPNVKDTSQFYIFDTVAALKSSTLSLPIGKVITTKGYYVSGDGGGSEYIFKTKAQATNDGDVYSSTSKVNIESVNGVAVHLVKAGSIKGLSCGISGAGVQITDSAALQEIFDTLGAKVEEVDLSGCNADLTVEVVAAFTHKVRILGGSIDGNSIYMDGCVEGCRIQGTDFARASLTNGDENGSKAIKLRATRRFTVDGCSFTNIDKSISSDQTATGFHTLGQIVITNNRFDFVNHAVYLDHDRAIPFVVSDLTFSDNVVGESYIRALWAWGLDGLIMDGNTIFSSAQGAAKRENVRVESLSDQLIITDNNLFTPGLECIYLTNPKSVVITGNNMVWAGTRVISSGVKIDGSQSAANLKIAANLIQGATKSSIEVIQSFAKLSIGGNQLVGDLNPIYYGVPDYLTLPRYGVEDTSNASNLPATNDYFDYEFDYLYKGFKFNVGRYGMFAKKVETVSAPDVVLFDFARSTGTATDYSAELKVLAEIGTGAKATYYFKVNQSAVGNEISAIEGYGLDSSSANWPAYTFTHVGNQLLATPVGVGGGLTTFTCSVRGESNMILQGV